MWPISRWAIRSGCRAEMLGICSSGTALLVYLILAQCRNAPLWIVPASLFGLVFGAASTFGGCLVVLRCLNIGPASLTVTANNLALLWPVTIGMIWFPVGESARYQELLGVTASVAALVLMAWSRPTRGQASVVSSQWVWWALAAWMLAGIANSALYLSSQYAPDDPLAFLICGTVEGTVLLGVRAAVRRQGFATRIECVAGGINGLIMAALLPLSLELMTRMSAAVVWPITVASPMVLMLLIGQLFLGERLTRAGWASGLLGIVGVIILASSGGV